MTHGTHKLSRRSLLAGLALVAAGPALAAEHPSLVFMRQVAKDLLNANRLGTAASFRRAIMRHADVADMADYSLGQYRDKLKSSQRGAYYEGTATFMARYLADMTRQYRVAKYELGDATADDNKDVLVTSKVSMMTGDTYTVTWRLAWRRGSYRVTDVKVLGFSLMYMQRGIFTSYVSKKNGDVGQLVAALNR
jgi:ABC-type transporter MlaC component